jgi:hypothetical protein
MLILRESGSTRCLAAYREEEAMIGHRAPFWSATLFLTTLLTCLFGADYALDHPRAATSGGEPINAVYFTDGYSAVLTVDRARALGMRPVATARKLQDEAERADAIIIERAMLPLVPPRWLAQQYRQGKTIAGINIPIAELARIAEYEGRVGGYLDSYGGRSFYAYFYRRRECGGYYGGSGSDAIYNVSTFLWLVQAKTAERRCQVL